VIRAPFRSIPKPSRTPVQKAFSLAIGKVVRKGRGSAVIGVRDGQSRKELANWVAAREETWMPQAHTQTTAKAALHEAMAELEGIAIRMSQKYPGDWYERMWSGPHLFYATFFYGVGFWVWKESGSLVLGMLGPVFWQIISVVVPRMMLGRIAHAPRWAHAAAKLDAGDTHTVNKVVRAIGGRFMEAMHPLLPVMTGDRFWIVLKHARIAAKRK
jgi:hypothetical protein